MKTECTDGGKHIDVFGFGILQERLFNQSHALVATQRQIASDQGIQATLFVTVTRGDNLFQKGQFVFATDDTQQGVVKSLAAAHNLGVFQPANQLFWIDSPSQFFHVVVWGSCKFVVGIVGQH